MKNSSEKQTIRARYTRFLGLGFVGAAFCLGLLLPQSALAIQTGPVFSVYATNGTTTISSGAAASSANGTDFGVCTFGRAYTNTLYVKNSFDSTPISINSWSTNGPGFTISGLPTFVMGANVPFTVIYCPPPSGSNRVSLVINTTIMSGYTFNPLTMGNLYTINLSGSSPLVTAPTISSQPVSKVVAIGQVASLSVTNSGTAPFGYQWLKDGVILAGQTNSTLTYDSFAFADSGSYSVVITNAQGMAISLPANLSTPNAPLRTWGNNGSGQLGNGSTTETNRPITMASNVVAVAGGQNYSLFVKADGTLWAAGNNSYGQLGNGTTNNSLTPIVVASNVVAAAAGYDHALFVKADGTLWSMGNNNYGQLGNGTSSNTNLPVQVASNVVAAAGGAYYSIFVKADGTLWAMGYNSDGQLGIGSSDFSTHSLPSLVASNVVEAVVGVTHTLFVKADGTLWTMGYNLQGQLGNGTTASANLPVRVASNVVAAAGGAIHSLFVKADGTLWAMGGNNKGQLGNGTKINTGTNPPIQVASNVVVATSGYWHSLFVKEDGTLWTMGSNIYGQLGNGNKTDTNWPVRVTGLLVAGLAKEPGASHSLAIAGALPGVSVSNRMVAVGQTTNFMALVTAGDGPFAYQWQFSGTNIVNATNDSYAIASAALSDAGSYAVIVVGTYGTATSSVATLTVNKANQTITFPAIGNKFTTDTVGLSATASSGLPVSFSVLSGLASLSGGTNLTFSAVGSVRIVASQAGDSSYNAAPNVTNTFNVEAPIPPAITVQPVSAVVTNGQAVSLSVSNNGTGPFGYQWLKDGAILSSQTNSTLSFSVFKFTDSGNYSLVITNAQGLAISIPASLSVTNALLLAWGNNGYGQFGSGTTASTNRPITIDSNVVAMASGCWHSLFVKAAGTLLATGYNGQGQLGNGTTAETTLPVQVTNNVVAVAAGRRHSLFVTTDGTLLAMGYNSNGQLGNGTTGVDVIRPIVVASNVVAVAAGEVHSLFVKADGTLWAMGFNNSGQLGNGTTGDTNRPVQVANNVVSVAAGSRYSLFVKADGTLWGMGQNFDGQLGNGMTVNTNRPVQVASQVVAMAAGNQHSLFEKADGTLWAMGANYAGQLGVNTCLTTNQPMLVANNVRAVACGGWHSLFVKANGTLWATGANSDGQLGDDTTTPSTVPVLVNGGSLLAVALAKGSEAFHSLAIAEFQAFSLQVRGTNGAVIASDAVVSAAKGTRFAPILSGGAVTNTFSITNNGTALLAISGAGIQGAGFRVQGIPATVAVGAVSNFTVVFNPDAVGDFTSVLSITNDSPTAVYTVNLAGSCYQLSVNRGPYIGGNTITITNGTFGTITNVLVGGVYANITGSGTTWFTITLPATGSAGTKDIVVQTSNNGDITLPGAYTVNPAGVIGLPAGPSVWTNLSSGMNSAALRSLCASTNGDLYALGYFTTAGGISANNISKWNGNTWTNLGAGIDLLPYDWAAMAIGSNGDLYAGGYFTNAGGHAANYVAKWDGSTWTNLGTGMSGRVFALATGSNGDLYAGGSFITAGGTAARYIAKWNGNSWTNLGAGMNDSVRSLSVAPNGDLYAGGGFTTAGGTTVNGIAKWNGSSWTNLGADMDNPAHALSVAPNGDLYAGGDFTTAGGTVANFIAKWNGSTWTNLGSGMNGSVQSLSVAPNGDVYAGGSFTTAGGATVNRIAKWSGSSWTNLSTGVNDIVYGLAQAPNGGVYAAGNFWMAGSLPVNGVAQWGSPIISATGVEPSNGIFAGGYPVTITGTNLCNGILGDVTNVTLYGVTATVTAVNGSTQVVVTAGVAGVTGLGDVRVCSISFGETVKNNAFEYMRAVQAPLVFSPATPQTFGTTNTLSVSGGSGTGVVSYAVLSGPGFIFGGTNLVVTNGVGIIQVEALKAQDGLYFVTSVTSGVTAAKAGQTITFPTIADQLTTNRVVLEATATSGLVPAFTVVSGSASISEGTNLTFTGAGSVSVVATQVGDGNWDPAVSVTNTFMVSLTAQAVLSFNPASPQTYATTNVLSASGGSGVGIVSYVVYSGPGTIFGNDSFRSSGVTGSYRPPTGAKLVVNSGTGTVVVVATKAASALYTAQSITGIVECAKAPASVELNGTNQVYSGAARVVTATTTPAGQTVDITYDGTTIAPTNVGTYTVAGIVNEVNYQGGTTGTLTITKATQTINFPNLGQQAVTNKVVLNATATSGLSVTNFSVVSGPAVISNAVNLSFISAGRVTLLATQSGDSKWTAAPAVTNAFDVIGVITNVTPTTGTVFGGTHVTIAGLWLGNGSDITNVTLCNITATIVTQTIHSVTVTAGVSPVGTNADVVVQSTGFGTVTLTNGFTYQPVPSPPIALSAIDVTTNRFTARWTSSDGATNYLLDVSETNTFTSYTSMYNNWNVGDVTACLVTGLHDGTTYYYRLRAANSYGVSTNSNTIEVPVSANTPYIHYEQTNGVASAGSSDVIDVTKLFNGKGMTYMVVGNSNTGLVTTTFVGTNLVLHYTAGQSGPAQITIRVIDEFGFWVETTISVFVAPAPSLVLGPITWNRMIGLFEQIVTVTNNSLTRAAKAVTLTVTSLSVNCVLCNATGRDVSGNPEIQWIGSLPGGASMQFTLQYYNPLRITPSATVLASMSLEDPAAAIHGTPLSISKAAVRVGLANNFLIQFKSVPGRSYYIEYAPALDGPWKTVYPAIVAPANVVQWIDSGPPSTESAPSSVPSRYYHVIEVQ